MYQSIPALTIPRAKPPSNFFDGRIPHPWSKKEIQNPHPWKRANIPPPGAFFSIIHYKKNMKKWDRNHVKLQDFIIFRWLKDKLGLQLIPVYIIGKFTLINCKTLYIFVRIYSLIRSDAIRRLGSIQIKINTQKKVGKYWITQISSYPFISRCKCIYP